MKRNSSKIKKSADLNVDCVAMVRKIRDANYLKTKGMSPSEELEYIHRRAKEIDDKLLANRKPAVH